MKLPSGIIEIMNKENPTQEDLKILVAYTEMLNNLSEQLIPLFDGKPFVKESEDPSPISRTSP